MLLVPPLEIGNLSNINPSFPASPFGPVGPELPWGPFSIARRFILFSLLSDITTLVVIRVSGSISCVITKNFSGWISSSTLTMLMCHKSRNHSVCRYYIQMHLYQEHS